MDRPEILANKGYESIADVLRKEGRESMQPLLDAANARADRERERAERAEALFRKYGCLI